MILHMAAALRMGGIGVSCWQYARIQGKDVAAGRVVELEPRRGQKGSTT